MPETGGGLEGEMLKYTEEERAEEQGGDEGYIGLGEHDVAGGEERVGRNVWAGGSMKRRWKRRRVW